MNLNDSATLPAPIYESKKAQLCNKRRSRTELLKERPSCVLCRKKKRKCDNEIPTCGHCRRDEEDCLYPHTLLGIARLGLDGRRRGRRATHAAGREEDIIHDASNFDLVRVDEISAERSCCESILEWPFLRDLTAASPVDSYLLEVKTMQTEAAQVSASTPFQRFYPPKRVRVLILCRDFVLGDQPRKLTIDLPEFLRYAREADEHGLGWDSRGCLVVSKA